MKTKKSDKIKKYNWLEQDKMDSLITDLPAYKEALVKGHPLFTKEELDTIKTRYIKVEGFTWEDRELKKATFQKYIEDGLIGLTWEDIERELSNKKNFLKKGSFRKYIQDQLVPGSIGYRKSETGRMAVFPPDIISRINLIQYLFKSTEGKGVAEIFKLVIGKTVTYLEAIESKLGATNLYAAINHALTQSDAEAEEAIKEGLKNKPEDQKKALKMLDEIDDAFESKVTPLIKNLINFLEEKRILVSEIPDD